jgi:very-short-patch-repair endonuclease
MRMNPHTNTPQDYQQARRLRNNASPVEQKLWRILRLNASVQGLKFRRQQVIHPYIVDFACMKARLIIEIDEWTHDARPEYDLQRTLFLETQNYHMLRFSNDQVMQNTEGVVTTILDVAQTLVNTRLEVGTRW